MKKVIALIAAFLIMLVPCFTVCAYPSSGSITVNMINKANKQPLVNSKVTAVKVADCTNTDADFDFSLDSAYGSGIDLNSSEAAGQIYSLLDKNDASSKAAVSDSDGTVVFDGCELGAYLVYSPDGAFSPFLAFVPMVTEDGINFNVKAEPKIDIPEEEPPTEPDEDEDEPTEPGTDEPDEDEEENPDIHSSSTDSDDNGADKKLPKTGMLQLPVPILGFIGALTFSRGFVLYAKGKKEED